MDIYNPPAQGGTPALVFSTTNVAGNGTTFIRDNDQIALFVAGTPAADTSAGTAGVGAFAARNDHSHPFAGAYMRFQNAGDAGKLFQRAVSGAVTTSTGSGAVFLGSGTVTFASTFAGISYLAANCPSVTGSTILGQNAQVISNTQAGFQILGTVVSSAGTCEVWGLG